MEKRIAVLISGEYRTFDICRPTMKFLDDENTDVYISTWDKSVYKMAKINLDRTEEVTLGRILSALGRPARICIENRNLFSDDRRYNVPMVHRWIKGFEMILDSGIEYDYVLITRPDIIFDKEILHKIDFEKYKDTVGFAWGNSIHLGKLSDIVFLSSFANMKKIFEKLTIDVWEYAKEGDWHVWWHQFVSEIVTPVNCSEFSHVIFCRLWADKSHSFRDVVNIQHEWRDLNLLNQCDMFGNTFAATCWPPEVYEHAISKWNSGGFKHRIYD